MDNLFSGSNPYIIDDPVTDSVMFFGHAEVMAWLKKSLRGERLPEPLILYGPPGIGKSSILKQLEVGYLGEDTAVFQFDIKSLKLENISEFLWDLSEKINKRTASPDVKILVSLVEKARFAENPEGAFNEFYSIITRERIPGKQLVLAFDDLDILAGQSQEGYPEHDILKYLHGLLQREKKLAYIFTLNGPVDKLPPDALAPFTLSTCFPVSHFDLETTQIFLRQSALFNTSAVVGEFIYNLTDGHPGDIQRFCYQLYERRRNKQLLHITLADVVAVTRQSGMNGQSVKKRPLPANGQSPEKSGFQTPVERKLTEKPATFIVNDPGSEQISSMVYPKRKTRQKRSSAKWLIAAIFLLILLFTGGGLVLASVLERPESPLTVNLPTNTIVPEASATSIAAVITTAGIIAPTQSRPEATNIGAPPLVPNPTVENMPSPTIIPLTATLEPLPPTATPSPEPTPFTGSEEFPTVITREADNMPMLVIPGSTFVMGAPPSDPSAGFDESPEHEVTIDTFYMDKYEVTVGQYAIFLTTLGTYEQACQGADCAWPRSLIGYTSYLIEIGEGDQRTYESMEGFENYPINHVSWFGADSYCSAVGARLPTEAEWEYAARGNDGRIYPWGNEAPDKTRAVYFSENYTDLKPVDALPDGASPFGIYALAGSMWEWVSDWYDPLYYSQSPADNPQGPEDGEGKVVRGGAWPNNNQADRIRSANRNWREIVFFSPDLGFRCAYDLESGG